MIDFRKILREERKKQGLTYKQLSEKSGYPAATIWSWESKEKNPKIESVEDILNALGLELVVRRKNESNN